MTAPPKLLLLIEDNPGDARLLREMLNEQGVHNIRLIHVSSMQEAEACLADSPVDMILLDLGLEDASGIEAVRRARIAAPRVPILVLTGMDDEVLAGPALQAGAQDYLVKGQIEARGLVRALRNAVERKALEEALFVEKERALVTLSCIADAVVSTDTADRLTFMNHVAEVMTGWSWAEVEGLPVGDVVQIVDAATREPLPPPRDRIAMREGPSYHRTDCVLLRRDGSELPVEDSIATIHGRDGDPLGSVVVFRDVSAARAMAQEMVHSAQHDFLTGLPNRMLLNDRVARAISIAPRHDKKVAVLFLDLDGFKHINDSLGHAVGDKLLQSIAQRLVGCVRASDTVSRQGGDEFVVLLSEVEQAEDAGILARRMLEAIAEPHVIDQHELFVTTSIGVSIFPEDGATADALVSNADAAMYQAKANGRRSYQFFRPAMNAQAIERQSIEESLRLALERGEFRLEFQPQVNLWSGKVSGAEALVRWEHPTRGLLPASQFIPVAEACGLMKPIGTWVIREACRQASEWLASGLRLPRITVNISASEFRSDEFLPTVSSILDETGLDPNALELELNESVLMSHALASDAILQPLRQRGVRIAVDDFGTGFSNLSYLRKFPIDTLKLDQSFVHQISAGGDTSIVIAVLHMARSLKLSVIAEGVETQRELSFLQVQRCDEAQGFFFSKPLQARELAKVLVSGILPTMAARAFETRIERREIKADRRESRLDRRQGIST